MEKTLTRLFDYQRFAGNPVLAGLINDTLSRYGSDAVALDDDEVELAAGGRALPTDRDPYKDQRHE